MGAGGYASTTRVSAPALCNGVPRGITDFRIDDLRHTCAVWLVQAGIQWVVIRELLGHGRIMMTERYAHLASRTVRQALDMLDASESRLSHVPHSISLLVKLLFW